MGSANGSRLARRGLSLAAAVGVLALAGCDWLADPSPDTARVALEGQDDPEVRVVVSTKFIAGSAEDGTIRVQLLASDTTLRSLPFDTTYAIGADRRFFLEVTRPDTGNVPGVHIRVFLDERERYDRTTVLAEDPIRFLYMFNQPQFTAIEVL